MTAPADYPNYYWPGDPRDRPPRYWPETEPTVRIPVVNVPSATITNSHALRARAAQRTRQRTRTQKRWDLLAQVLSYLCFAGILVCLVGISVAGVLLALSMADDQTAVPLPDTTIASVTSLPTLTVPGAMLGGVTAASTTSTAAARPTTGTQPTQPTTTAPTTATTAAEAPTTARHTPTPTTSTPTPSPTTVASTTTTTTTAPVTTVTTAAPSTTPQPTDPPTTTAVTEPAPTAST